MVEEVHHLGLVKVIGILLALWEGVELVALAVGLDAVVADGHADFVFTLRVGHDGTVFALYKLTIHLESYAIDGDVGILIEYLSLDDEGRLVAEVVVVLRQRVGTDISRAAQRFEAVNALAWRDGIAGAGTSERNASDDVVTLVVGHAVARQLLRGGNQLRGLDVIIHRGVATVGIVVGARGVEGQMADGLVQRPVDLQPFFISAQRAVVVVFLLLGVQHVVPDAHLRDVAVESGLWCHKTVTTDSEREPIVVVMIVLRR